MFTIKLDGLVYCVDCTSCFVRGCLLNLVFCGCSIVCLDLILILVWVEVVWFARSACFVGIAFGYLFGFGGCVAILVCWVYGLCLA